MVTLATLPVHARPRHGRAGLGRRASALTAGCLLATAIALAMPQTAAAADWLATSSLRSDTAALEQPALSPVPAAMAPFVDPVFGTALMRLTETALPAAGDGDTGIVPEYSKAQAWNSDQSLVLLRGLDGSSQLYNGQTFAGPLPTELPVGDIEPRWAPDNPDRLYYLLDDRVWKYSVATRRSRVVRRIWRLGGALSSGSEQDVPLGGRYLAVHGDEHYDSAGRWSWTRATVVDLLTGGRGPIVTLRRPAGNGGDFLDYIAIAPDGTRLMVMWASHGADLYRRDWTYLRRLTTWDEHGDFCRDPSGRWWFVQARYRPVPNDEVVVASSLAGLPRRTLWLAPRYNMALHVSCRNHRLRNWAYISSYWDGLGQRPAEVPVAFENELFALSLDSTPSTPIVRRIAHTRMVERADYFDEPHATVSRDGRMVLLGTNFGQAVEAGYDDTLLVDLRGIS